jgi:coproporphyrinogen III oxidase-like Fe-S oxidoreductase
VPPIGLTRSLVPAAELPFEYLLNALRLNEGFEQREFEARTGLPVTVLEAGFAAAQQRGLLERCGTRWRASARGFNFLNDLLALLLPAARSAAIPTPAPLGAAAQNFPVEIDAWV